LSAHIIELKNIVKRYGSADVLSNIALNVKNREFLTILGPSGCGKTTLLRVIAGFERPDQGEIWMHGKNMFNVPPHLRSINTVFQSYALFPHLNVFNNVAFGLRCKRFSKKSIESKVKEALGVVKLEKFLDHKIHQLSGGQQQRVAIARAIVNEPQVLLLDEPMSSLDYHLRRIMQIELKQLQAQLGITFILVTHDQDEALSMADRVVVMDHGCIVQVGQPREIYEQPKNLHVARFSGEINVLNTKVLAIEHEKLTLEIEGRKFYSPYNMQKVRAESCVYTLIRPKDLKILKQHDAAANLDNGYLAEVLQVIYKGSTIDFVVKLETETVVLVSQFFEESNHLSPVVGDRVWVSWKPGVEKIIFDEAV